MVEKAMLTQVVVTPLYMINRRWLYDKLLNDPFGMPSYKLVITLMVFDNLELLPFVR
jgi:DNA polymerase sigma